MSCCSLKDLIWLSVPCRSARYDKEIIIPVFVKSFQIFDFKVSLLTSTPYDIVKNLSFGILRIWHNKFRLVHLPIYKFQSNPLSHANQITYKHIIPHFTNLASQLKFFIKSSMRRYKYIDIVSTDDHYH